MSPSPELTALLDANVLYPVPLRDLLMHLATARTYRARWSAQIHEEWIRNLLLNRLDLTRQSLEGARDLMEQWLPDAAVAGHENLIETLELPDAGDRHVVAAAIAGHADVIVTCNLKHFPKSALDPYCIVAQHPDEFIHELMDADEDRVCLAVKRQRTLLKNPPITIEKYLQTLENLRLPRTVARLRLRQDEL